MKYVEGMNFVVLVLALIAFAIATGLAHLLTNALEKIERMEKAYAEDRLQWEAQNANLVALNADMHDALKECQELHKASERQTVEIEATIPARPKRNSKGQFVKKVESNG